ncbi:helix-turn-helix transcriptional regulator [Actinomadura fulvescens]|uniref:Helix-turn-helix transcriptional regulator n=1 Tax=Actinomadura fulvescens TaxID=46160 RepID=A0ABP6CCJ5_9ACTN
MPAVSEPHDAPAIVTFARELTAWREQAGLSKKQLAEALGFTDSYVGQVELCKNIPSEEFAEALNTYFKTNGLFVRLRQRILETRHAVAPPPGFNQYLEREQEARYIRVFSALLVNGLFQTKDYASAMMGTVDEFTANEFVTRRMERQAILTRENPPQVLLTLDESVLHRVIGSRDVHRAQLEALLEASERPNITIDVVPQNTGYYPGLAGSFTLLGFNDGTQAVYIETQGTGQFIEQPSRIPDYLVQYDLIKTHAYHLNGTRTLISSKLESL